MTSTETAEARATRTKLPTAAMAPAHSSGRPWPAGEQLASSIHPYRAKPSMPCGPLRLGRGQRQGAWRAARSTQASPQGCAGRGPRLHQPRRAASAVRCRWQRSGTGGACCATASGHLCAAPFPADSPRTQALKVAETEGRMGDCALGALGLARPHARIDRACCILLCGRPCANEHPVPWAEWHVLA